MQYVVACYTSANSMSWHSMSKRQALCHDMVCHINRYHIITQYATTISIYVITTYVTMTSSMSLQHEISRIKNNHYNIINHFLKLKLSTFAI